MREKPLSGKRILITRAQKQSLEFSSLLKKNGAEVIELPLIEMVPPRSWRKVDRAIDRLKTYDWLIFTSANGVDFFFERLKQRRKTSRALSSLNIGAIGPATASRLAERKVSVHLIPKKFIAESILEAFKRQSIEGKKILLARAQKARDLLPKGLEAMGAKVDVIEVYRTLKPRGGRRRLKTLLKDGKVDVITFTSSSTVTHFVELLKGDHLKDLLHGVIIASIGPVTSKTARQWGMEVQIEPEEYTIMGLTRAMVEYFKKVKKSRKTGTQPEFGTSMSKGRVK